MKYIIIARQLTLAAAWVFCTPATLAGEVKVPHTFTSGTPAKASEINENFATVASAVNALSRGGLTCSTKVAANLDPKNFADRQVTLTCDSGSIMVSGGAACYDYGNWMSRLTRSFPSGNGWAATCQPYNYNGSTSNEGAQIIANVYVRCCN